MGLTTKGTTHLIRKHKQTALESYSEPQVAHQQPPSEEVALVQIEVREEQRLLKEQYNGIALNKKLDHKENTE
jgi:hypothetical protein